MMVSHSGRQLGPQLNSSSVAKRREGAAPQLSLRRLPQFLHPHHFQHPRRLHRQLRRQLSLPHPVDPWIPSTAQSILRTRGPQIRRSGAAESTTAAALSQSFQSFQFRSLSRHQPILTIAPMGSQIGKQAGQWQRRSGAAEFTARVVPIKAVVA